MRIAGHAKRQTLSLKAEETAAQNGTMNRGHTVNGGQVSSLLLCFPGELSFTSRVTLSKPLNLSRPGLEASFQQGSESAFRWRHQPWQALIRPWLDSLFSMALETDGNKALTGSRNQSYPLGRCPFVKNLAKIAFILLNPQHSFIHCLTHKIYDICWRNVALNTLNVKKYI